MFEFKLLPSDLEEFVYLLGRNINDFKHNITLGYKNITRWSSEEDEYINIVVETDENNIINNILHVGYLGC